MEYELTVTQTITINTIVYSDSKPNNISMTEREVAKLLFSVDARNPYLICDLHEQKIPNSGMLTVIHSSDVNLKEVKRGKRTI